jgi:Ca-activated chloride channel family protein
MVVGPRFIPGQPVGRSGTGWAPDSTQVPDASRITPPLTPEGTRAGHDISLEVEIDAGLPILDLDSRLHAIESERPEPTRAHVKLRNQSEIPNRDFVLRYAVAGDEVKSGVLVHRNGAEAGYVTFVLLPPKRVTPETAAPKELVFVIDRSGSQTGLPLLKAKETMLWILDHLNPNDTFQIVSFSNAAEMLFDRPRPAGAAAIREARAYVNSLEANGGTMMAEAVQSVCAAPAEANRLRVVTFMTDGYIGNDFEVIDLVKRLRGTSRWFPFGTGNSVNRFLLEQMAREGGGEVEYVLLNEDGQKVAKSFYERIAWPVLTDVRLEFRNLDVVDVLPYEVSDVWAQKPLIIHARYRRAGRGTVALRGFRGGQAYEQTLEVDLPERAEGNGAIASMWARARVDDLMARDLMALQRGNFPDALREEIVQVALTHRIMTQFTSFIAVEDRVVNENGTQRHVTVPVEMPQGVAREGIFGHTEADAMAYGVMSAPGVLRHQSAPALSKQALRGRAAKELTFEPEETPTNKLQPELLPAKLREKLGPTLRALLEGRTSASRYVSDVDGTIRVRVALRERTEAGIEALKRAGLRITLTTDQAVVGSIVLSKLEALVKLEFVDEVTLR